MKKHPSATPVPRFLPLLLGFLFLALHPAFPAAATAVENIEAYQHVLDSLLTSPDLAPAPTAPPPPSATPPSPADTSACATDSIRLCPGDRSRLAGYFQGQKRFADTLENLLVDGYLPYETYSGKVQDLLKGMLREKDEFFEPITSHRAWIAGDRAYSRYLNAPLLLNSYAAYATASGILLQEKYFSDLGQGNFLEGFVNGKLGFTRAHPGPSLADSRNFGVSPWEFVARVDPIYVFRSPDAANFGGLFTLGMLYHLFPKVTVKPDNQVEVHRGFLSNFLKQVGAKGGIGLYGEDDGDDLLWTAGGAVQVSSFSLWVLSTWQDDQASVRLALGMSDLKPLQALLPPFAQ